MLRKFLDSFKPREPSLPPYPLVPDYSGVQPPANPIQFRNLLRQLNIPGDVVHWNIGPTTTVFTVVPDDKVRVKQLKGACEDIAMRLNVPSVQYIGRLNGGVAFEVANPRREMVELTIDHFNSEKLPVYVGATASGEHLVIDLAECPHLLVAGATGAGKSVFLNSMLAGWLYTRFPIDLRLFLIDPKEVELTAFEGLPHLKVPIVTNAHAAASMLSGLVMDMRNRYNMLKAAKCRNIGEYEARFGYRCERWVVVIDEFADLIQRERKEVTEAVIALTALGRASGVHVVLCTQKPKAEVVPTLIRDNFPTRIAFAVPTALASRLIIDTDGAEKLQRKGDLLMMTTEGTVRAQGPFISNDRLEDLIRHWRG